MRIVAVTACATGIAHTYMAAEQLDKVAKVLGYEIKVETQGALGIDNELSESDIRNAEVAILAADIKVEKPERFGNMKLIHVSVLEAIQNPEGIFARIRRNT